MFSFGKEKREYHEKKEIVKENVTNLFGHCSENLFIVFLCTRTRHDLNKEEKLISVEKYTQLTGSLRIWRKKGRKNKDEEEEKEEGEEK